MKKHSIDNRIKRIVSGVCALVLMGAIFFFSAQPGDASDETSMGLLAMLFGQGLDFALLWNALARKIAHVLEYGALTVPVFFFFSNSRLTRAGRNLATALFCILYAVSDEFHQRFVEARSCEAFDVLVDSIGVLLAVAGLYLLTRIISRRRQKNEPPVDRREADGLVLAAFSAAVTGGPLTQTVPDAQFDAFFERSFAHKILPMTADALWASGAPLAPAQRKKLKRTATAQTVGQIRRTETFLAAYRAMREGGATPLCVKGIVCRSFYPNPDLRVSADEDLLVRETEFALCMETLRSLGFASDGPENDYEVTFCHRESGCVIELHRSLFPEDGGVYSRFNEALGDLFRAPASITVGGTQVFCPAPDDHLLYMALHAFKHFLVAGVGIRQIADIAVFAEHNPVDWQAVFETCADLRLAGFLSAVLRIGSDWFGLDLSAIRSPLFDASVDTAPLLDDVMAGGVYGSRNTDHRRSGNMTFKAYSSALLHKKASVLSTLFPQKASMRRRYPFAAKHAFLLPAAYLARIFGYLFSRHDSVRTLSTAESRSALMKRYGIY